MAKEFYAIGYRGWYVLETGSPNKDIVADTRANIEYSDADLQHFHRRRPHRPDVARP